MQRRVAAFFVFAFVSAPLQVAIAATLLFGVGIFALPGGMTRNAVARDLTYLARPDRALRVALAGGRGYLKAWLIAASAGVRNSVPTTKRAKSSTRRRGMNLQKMVLPPPAQKPWPDVPASRPRRCIASYRTRRRCSRAWCLTGSTDSCPTSTCMSPRTRISKQG